MGTKNSNNKFIVGIAVALMVPLFCFLAVSKMSKGKVIMPGHYFIDTVVSKEVNGKTVLDTIYHKVAELELTNQLGEKVNLNEMLKDQMLVIDFFFTDCASSCPKMSKSMRLLQTSFKKDPKKESSLDTVVHFISITVNPGRDSFQVLRTYADRYDANPDHWWFLTGDKKTIYDYARKQLGVVTGPGDGGADDFIHSEKLVLVDKDRQIRGYYNGLNDTDVRKCADDIVLLTLEKKKNEKPNLNK